LSVFYANFVIILGLLINISIYGVFLTFSERLKEIRGNIPQAEFAERIGIGLRTYIRYEKEESQPDLPVLLEIHKKFDININWLATGEGNKTSLDSLFSPYFEILNIISPSEKREQHEVALLDDMIHSLNIKIADLLVESLATKVSEISLLEKLKKMIIMNGVGATVRIWSIVEQASKDDSKITAKEKLLNSAQKGFMLVLPTKAERDFLVNWVEMWPEEMCTFILQNNQSFVHVLKKISPQAESAISSNEKILKFIRRFSKSI
jgi:transcriptional regulator with XRE-family HTH domain